MSAGRTRARDTFLVIGLSALLLAGALIVGPAVSQVKAGSPGTCILEVSASDKTWGDTATVVPLEDFYIQGAGWAPNTQATLNANGFDFASDEDDLVNVDADGIAYDAFTAGVGTKGTWTFTLTQTTPSCSKAVTFKVLPLTDVWNSKFMFDIKYIFEKGITAGCGGDKFCPNGLVTRAQMATFLSRALKLPAATQDYFTDDTGSVHEANINRLAAAGITAGCSATKFCPNGLVTRAQMATFLVRAYRLPSTATDWFIDDTGSIHESNINRLRSAGITGGCGGANFCPNGIVTRGQMAAFLHRAQAWKDTH